MRRLAADKNRPDLLDLTSLVLLAVMITLSFLLIYQVWQETRISIDSNSREGKAAVLIVYTDQLQSDSFRIMRGVFNEYDFVSRELYIDKYNIGNSVLADNISHMADEQDINTNDVWLIFTQTPDVLLWQQAAKADCAGAVIVATDDLTGNLTDLSLWPQHRPLALFYGLSDPRADKAMAIESFEWYTGEDASLYTGAFSEGFGSTETYRSVDGSFLLALYPELTQTLAFISPTLISDVILSITAWQFSDEQEIPSRPVVLNYMQPCYLRLLLSFLIIFCLPTLLILSLRHKIFRRKPPISGRSIIYEFICWLPGIMIASALSVLFTAVGGNKEIFLISLVIILPGADGWFRLSAGQIRKAAVTGSESHRTQMNDKTVSYGRLASVFALTAMTFLVILFFLWRYLLFGWSVPPSLPLHIFPVLFLFSAASGFDTSDLQTGKDLRLTLIRQWPYLALLITSLILMRGDMIISALLVLLISFWSTGAGKAISTATNKPFAGSLVRSLLMVSAWMLPPVLQGFVI